MIVARLRLAAFARPDRGLDAVQALGYGEDGLRDSREVPPQCRHFIVAVWARWGSVSASLDALSNRHLVAARPRPELQPHLVLTEAETPSLPQQERRCHQRNGVAGSRGFEPACAAWTSLRPAMCPLGKVPESRQCARPGR